MRWASTPLTQRKSSCASTRSTSDQPRFQQLIASQGCDAHPCSRLSLQVDQLLGDPRKAKAALGWECKIKFSELVEDMMRADLADVLTAEHDA